MSIMADYPICLHSINRLTVIREINTVNIHLRAVEYGN